MNSDSDTPRSGPLRVLIVEDSEDDALLVVRELRREGYEPDWRRVETPEDMEVTLRDQEWDVVLADYRMPRFSAPSALKLLQDAELDLPFIVISGTVGEDVAVEVMKAGAHDFFAKGSLTRLVPAIQREMREVENRRRRRAAEQALRESEVNYRLLADNTLDVIWTMNMQLEFMYVNRAISEMTGYGTDEWIGSRLPDHCDEAHLAELGKIIQRELAKGPEKQGIVFETEMLRKDGSPIPLEIHAKILFDDEGAPVAIQGTARDITERRRAEERQRHISAILSSIRSVNQLIVREKRRGPLIEGVCKPLVSTRGFRGAWIILTDRHPGALPNSQFGFLDDQFREFADRVKNGSLPTCCKRATSEGGVVGIVEPLRECSDCPLALSYNGGAALVAPVVHDSVHFGFMGVSVPPQYLEDLQEKSLLAEIAGDIAFALNSIELEAQREKSEKTLRALFESASDGILLADVESGRFVLGNDAICRMLGCSADEIAGLSVAEIHPADKLEHVRAQFEKQARGELTMAEDIPMKRKDGNVFAAEVSSAPLELDGRRHLVGIFRDVTERKETQKALKEAYDIINRSSSVAFTWKNMEGWPVEFVSENVQRLLGYTSAELIRGEVNYTACIHPQDLPRVAAEVVKYSSQEETQEFLHEPYRVVAKDGTEKIMRDRTSIVRGNDGRITHYKGIVEDITEQRAMEAQLRQAQKMEAVGTLAGGVAHDFNNILQVALGYSELLLGEGELPERYRTDIKRINESARRGADLVKRLLTFSRKTEMTPQPLNLNQRIDEVRKMLERTIPKMIEMQILLDEDLARVDADSTQIDQVLMNLAVNARDAMPEGGQLTFETANAIVDEGYARSHLEAKPGPHVLLTVTDTGYGMEKDTLEHIFEPFYTTKGVGEGTGLGLAMVHGIVKQHGGHIRCYSEPGKGTTFKIYLPALISEEQESETIQSPMPRGGSETILLVDDEEMIRDLGSRVLTKAGYTVIVASNGKEALDVYQKRSHDIALVILDLIMPEMGGRQCLEAVLDLNPSAKVVIASGFSANGPTKDALEAGAKGFVNKPYEMVQMLESVRQVLDSE